MANLSAPEGSRRLSMQIQAAERILAQGVSEAELHAWTKTTEELLARIYGSESSTVRGLKSAAPRINLSAYKNPSEMSEHHRQSLKARRTYVESVVASLNEDARSESEGTGKMPLEEPNKIILAWSGKTSQTIALFLHGWWPKAVPGVTTWISTEDIAKGDRWFPELMAQLGKSTTCVICVTPENHKAPWVYYEAGVIASKQEHGKVCTVLFGVTTANIKDTPLAQFQATEADDVDFWRLVKSINSRLTVGALDEGTLRARFDEHWTALNSAVVDALSRSSAPTVESAESIDLLSENGLSDEAKELLREGCQDRNGRIYQSHLLDGTEISTNNRNFIEKGSARSAATWISALDQLDNKGLVEDRGHKREVFAVTGEGFKVGDML